MHIRFKSSLSVFLTGVMILSLLVGCAASTPSGDDEMHQDPDGSYSFEKQDDDLIPDVTKGVEIPDFPEKTDQVTAQFRQTGKSPAWHNTFTSAGGFLIIEDAASLVSELQSRNIDLDTLDLTAYNDAFFSVNRLFVMPKTSGSGSLVYQAETAVKDQVVTIYLTGKIVGEGTMDMADWLVFAALPRDSFGGGYTFVVDDSAVPNTGDKDLVKQ